MPIKEMLTEKQKRRLYTILDLLPDKLVIHLQYYAALGRKLNLKRPSRFTEKVQWYKLNYQDPLMTVCADKYKIRSYISTKKYDDYLPSFYGVFDNFEEINFESLPNSFVIKANNGSGTNIFVKDKSKMNLSEIEKNIKLWKKVNTLSIGREWVYENIEQKIVIEELLKPSDEFQKVNGLNDYKFMCFNGKAEIIWVDVSRNSEHRRNFYDLDWNMLDVTSDVPQIQNSIDKPFGFEKMLEIANDFSKDFPFVRVDFYSVNNKLYIGELTFYPWSGTVQFNPDSFDYELGELFNLPKNSK